MKFKPILAHNCAVLVVLYFSSRSPCCNGNELAEAQLNSSNICGQRSFCYKFPSLCRAFGKSLFDGFRFGELPFIGRLRIIEQYSEDGTTPQTRECLAVAISDRDLLVNGECLESNKTKIDGRNAVVINDYNVEQHFEVTPLDSKKVSLITTIGRAIHGTDSQQFSASGVAEWIKCAIDGNEKVKMDGIVCGLMPAGKSFDSTLQYTCQGLHASSFDFVEEDAKSPNFSQDEFNDLLAGAAIFRRSSTNDIWSLIGFTNTDGTVTSLSQVDCTSVERLTRGRIGCAADVPAPATPGRVLPVGGPFFSKYGDDGDADRRGSALFPLIIMSMILMMAVIIFGFLVRESTTRRSYQYI